MIIPREIKELMDYGVCRIYSPEDGREMGLEGMIADMLQRADFSLLDPAKLPDLALLVAGNVSTLASVVTWFKQTNFNPIDAKEFLEGLPVKARVPVIGLTGNRWRG